MKVCPKCGAEGKWLRTDNLILYPCGSYSDANEEFRESQCCLRNQLTAAQAEIEKLRGILATVAKGLPPESRITDGMNNCYMDAFEIRSIKAASRKVNA